MIKYLKSNKSAVWRTQDMGQAIRVLAIADDDFCRINLNGEVRM